MDNSGCLERTMDARMVALVEQTRRARANVRFHVKHVPVPGAGYIVCDTWALPVRLHADGVLYNRYERHAPHSHYYDTYEAAEAVATWLVDRVAGYPFNLALADSP